MKLFLEILFTLAGFGCCLKAVYHLVGTLLYLLDLEELKAFGKAERAAWWVGAMVVFIIAAHAVDGL